MNIKIFELGIASHLSFRPRVQFREINKYDDKAKEIEAKEWFNFLNATIPYGVRNKLAKMIMEDI
jgi:hypothetical protein